MTGMYGREKQNNIFFDFLFIGQADSIYIYESLIMITGVYK